MKTAQKCMMGVETNITNWQLNQNKSNNYSAIIPYDLEQQRTESRIFLDDLQSRDQRMFMVTITMVHTADSLEELNRDTESLCGIARKKMCQIAPLTFQQLNGLNTTLPAGLKKLEIDTTMTTESLSAFIPFNTQDIEHPHGVPYGQNVVSGNMVLVDRTKLQNGNVFILGISGSGKSMAAKNDIISNRLRLGSDADIIIIDPDSEYWLLTKKLGGEVIELSETSNAHINAMDMCQAYDESIESTLRRKQGFVLSLCEEIVGGEKIDAKEKSLIDRCTGHIYREYIKSGFTSAVPTLENLYQELMTQNEEIGKEIALKIELYAKGSMDTFAQQTNVDTKSSLVCYDIHGLDKDLMTVGMLVILDNIMNRIAQNRENGRQTFIYIDEIYFLFLHEYSAEYLYKLWKRCRKYGAECIGITQNVEDVLRSQQARALIANSEFLILLNQSSTDRPVLAKLLNIPRTQLSHITGAKFGHGLLKIGNALIPFANEFPSDTELYSLMTTKPDEVQMQKEKAVG